MIARPPASPCQLEPRAGLFFVGSGAGGGGAAEAENNKCGDGGLHAWRALSVSGSHEIAFTESGLNLLHIGLGGLIAGDYLDIGRGAE